MKLKLLFGVILITPLAFCSYTALKHQAFCEKDSGTVVYKKVKADGYYHAQCSSSCWGQFLGSYERSGLTFMEFNNERAYSTSYITEKGYWRYFIANKGNKFCNNKISKKLDSYSAPDDFIKQFREEKCVAAKQIEAPTARYIYERSDETFPIGGIFGSEVTKIVLAIKDSNDSSILGRTVEYMLDMVPDTPNEGGRKSCKEYTYPTTPYLFEEVLTPNS